MQKNMKRSRGRSRRPNHNNANRSLDSNGPDVKIRGTAAQICDKYQALARDAKSAGDRIRSENYLQHAEHYLRLVRSAQQAAGEANARNEAQNTQSESSRQQPENAEGAEPKQTKSDGPDVIVEGAAATQTVVTVDASQDADKTESAALEKSAPEEAGLKTDSQASDVKDAVEKPVRKRRPRKTAANGKDSGTARKPKAAKEDAAASAPGDVAEKASA